MLNAGVVGFNVIQEELFYRRYNWRVNPDTVLLTFHNNDLQYVQMVYGTTTGTFFYIWGEPPIPINPKLLTWSRIYQKYAAFRWAKLSRDAKKEDRLLSDTRAALQRLKQQLSRSGKRFKVLLLPVLKPIQDWGPIEQQSRNQALGLLKELDIETLDLLEPLDRGLQANIDPKQSPDDAWHPSDAIAKYFARHLKTRGLLD